MALGEGGELVVSVLDDGLRARAAPGAAPRHGLASLRRAVADAGGSAVVESADPFGTRVRATFPL